MKCGDAMSSGEGDAASGECGDVVWVSVCVVSV